MGNGLPPTVFEQQLCRVSNSADDRKRLSSPGWALRRSHRGREFLQRNGDFAQRGRDLGIAAVATVGDSGRPSGPRPGDRARHRLAGRLGRYGGGGRRGSGLRVVGFGQTMPTRRIPCHIRRWRGVSGPTAESVTLTSGVRTHRLCGRFASNARRVVRGCRCGRTWRGRSHRAGPSGRLLRGPRLTGGPRRSGRAGRRPGCRPPGCRRPGCRLLLRRPARWRHSLWWRSLWWSLHRCGRVPVGRREEVPTAVPFVEEASGALRRTHRAGIALDQRLGMIVKVVPLQPQSTVDAGM